MSHSLSFFDHLVAPSQILAIVEASPRVADLPKRSHSADRISFHATDAMREFDLAEEQQPVVDRRRGPRGG